MYLPILLSTKEVFCVYTVKIMNEYLHGPIWIYNPDGVAVLRYPPISDDPVLCELNRQAMEMFSGYYEFDSHGQPCWFNHDLEREERDAMLILIRKIRARLDEINDGSFVVEDLETARLNSL